MSQNLETHPSVERRNPQIYTNKYFSDFGIWRTFHGIIKGHAVFRILEILCMCKLLGCEGLLGDVFQDLIPPSLPFNGHNLKLTASVTRVRLRLETFRTVSNICLTRITIEANQRG